MTSEWNVHPYDAIERLELNMWEVEGDIPDMGLRRRMVVIKRSDSRLVIHNGIALHEDDMAEIEAWGEPTYLLVPSSYHRLDAAAYKARYPQIKVFCPEGAHKAVSEVVAVDGSYDDFPEDQRVKVFHLEGIKKKEGGLLIHHGPSMGSTTLVVNDAIFNQPHLSGIEGWIMWLLGSTGAAKVTRIFRWLVIHKRKPFKEHLLRLAATPGLSRLVMSHGDIIEDEVAATLKRVASKL